MKKYILFGLSVFGFLIGACLLFGSPAVHAQSVFNYTDHLMDDPVFRNSAAMTNADIQTLLQKEGSGLASFSDIENCGSTSGPHYSYYATYYSCGNRQSASKIIYDAAQAYGINPQVILATMQKEQSLVTTPNPSASQLNYAMGYGCPDSGGCSYAGFFNQVDNGTWQFRVDYELASGNNYWGYTPSSYPCNGATRYYNQALLPGRDVTFFDDHGTAYTHFVLPDLSTASLYCYTPHAYPGSSQEYYSGSYWFVYYFNLWFVPYSWRLQGVSYSTGTNVFGSGETGTVTVSVINTGSVPWYNYGNSPVRLGTWSPNRVSPLYSSGWLSSTRPANMNENQVQPGSTATFTFPITVSTTGTYVEALNLVVENSQWMPWPGLSPTITIKPRFQWQIGSVSYSAGTGLMVPGTTQQVTVTATNTGFDTWSNTSGPAIRLGTWLPDRASLLMPSSGSSPKDWISSARPAGMTESSVAPGQTGTFQFYVRPPNVGNFYERFNLVAENQAWFNDPGLTLYLRGGAYAWQPVSSSYSTGGNANLPRGTTFTVTVKAQNTGELAWSNTSSSSLPWPTNLATDTPEDRGSFLYDSSWLTGTRPVSLHESIVQPGQTGTFTFTANVPSSASLGPHYEHFNLVAEGFTWFSNPNFSLYINVQ